MCQNVAKTTLNMCQNMCPKTSPPSDVWEGKFLQTNFKLDDAPRGERFRTQ